MNNSSDLPALVKAVWQTQIFAAAPRRSALLSLKPSWPCRKIGVRVHRNMPFEFVASALPAFLAYADLQAEVVISDYDDALNFAGGGAADCEIIWLDFGRYKMGDEAVAAWLQDRLQVLRGLSQAPILVADGGGASAGLNQKLGAVAAQVPGCRVFPRQEIQDRLGASWFDDRVKEISASSMSNEATVAVAQAFGLSWVPGAVAVGLKAIALDLDNTLYAGVLGEDGVAGVQLTDAHRALQQKILALKQQGLFLALLSRNEVADVEKLFQERGDFPLKWQDFSAHSIGWGEKTDGLDDIAAQLRIHPNAILVLDDNMGEVGKIAQKHAGTPLLYAADAEISARALGVFPGLLRWHRDKTDSLRADDLKASAVRTEAQREIQDPIAYMRFLEIKLHFWCDPREQLGRLTDLANKTNQFALSLLRPNEAEIARRLESADCASIAVALADKMSDSGVIAAVFCKKEKDAVVVDEICVSCRALGRGIEDLMIATAIDRAVEKLKTDKVVFAYGRGPRNDPARHWLEAFAGVTLVEERGRLEVDWARLRRKLSELPVQIEWK